MKSRGLPVLSRTIATALASFVFCSPAHGVDGTWTLLNGGNASGPWGDPTNWLNGQVAGGIDAVANFSTLNIASLSDIFVGGLRTVGTLKFADAGNATNDWRVGFSPFGGGGNDRLMLDVTSGQASIQVLNRTVTMDATLYGNDGINVGSGGGPGGRLILTAANIFSGGLTISGGVVQLNHPDAVASNTITVNGTSVATRLEIGTFIQTFSPTAAVVIADGVTPGAGRGVIEATGGRWSLKHAITISGSTGNGGHFSSNNGGELVLLAPIESSVPVVQAGGTVIYGGGGNYTALDVTGTAITQSFGISRSAILSLGASGAGDGSLELGFSSQTLAGLILGRPGSTDRGSVGRFSALQLTGNLTTRGDAMHVITSALWMNSNNAILDIEDGAQEIDLLISGSFSAPSGAIKKGAGTLQLTAGAGGDGTFAVAEGTLAGNPNFFSGALTVASGAALTPGTRSTAGEISARSIAFGPGTTTVNMNVGTGGDSLTATGADGLRADGITTLNITQFGGPLAIGTHDLIHYMGTIQGAGFGGFQATLPVRTFGALVNTGSAVALEVTGNDAVIWTGAVSGAWDTGATENWKLQSSGAPDRFLEYDDAIFDDNAAIRNVILAAPVSPSRVTFANSAGVPYTVAGAGGFVGSMVLNKTGSGTVTLRTAASHAGTTTIGAGTLQVDYPQGSLTATSEVSISSGAMLKLTSANADFAFDRPLSGAGTVMIDANAGGTPGSRTVNFSGANSQFTGRVILSPTPGGGSLRTEPVFPSVFGTAEIVVKDGAQVQLGSGVFSNAIQISGIGYIEAAGGIPHPGAGLGAAGGRGALSLGFGAVVSGPILLAGNAKISGVPISRPTISGDITSVQPGDQLVVGGGTFTDLTLTGTNSYGPTWINSGFGAASGAARLRIGNGGLAGTLGTGDVTLLGEANASAVLHFDRADGYVLGSNITGIGNAVRTAVEIDVRGAGIFDDGRTIDLGPASAGGVVRIGTTRSDARAIVTGSWSAGTFRVGGSQAGAALEVRPGASISAGTLNVGFRSGVTQSGGVVSVADRIDVTGSSDYRLDGGALTITANAGSDFPYNPSYAGGIHLGSAGAGSLTQTGGALSTNWIVLDQPVENPVRNSYTLDGGSLELRSGFGLISRFDSTVIALNGGILRAAPGISPNLDSPTISIGGAMTLDTNGANAFTLYGPLGGSGAIRLTGGGTLRLADGTGGTYEIPGSTLPGGSLRGVSVTLAAGTTLLADRTGTDIWTGALGGAGTLRKQKAGSLFITGSGSGFTGAVTVAAGRLDLPGDAVPALIAVADGAALGGEPAAASLTLGTAAGSRLFFDGSTASALTTGSLAVNGPATIDFSAAPVAPGTITVLNYGTRSGSGAFALAGAADYRAASVADTGSSITVSVTAKNLRWTGANGVIWNLKSAANFTDGANAETFFAGDTVTFDDTGANPAIALAGRLSPWRVTVAADSMSYSFSGAPISGPGSLVKSGAATLTLASANSYSGPTILNGGTIRIAAAAALGDGSVTNALVFDGGRLEATDTLDLAVTRALVIGSGGGTLAAPGMRVLTAPGPLSGSGTLRVTGGGTVALAGNASGFTGDVTVDSIGAASGGTILRLGRNEALTGGGVTLKSATVSGAATTLELGGVGIGGGVALALETSAAGGNSFRSRLSTSAGINTWSGPISITGDGVAEISTMHKLTVTGPIAEGAGGFSGILQLRGTGTQLRGDGSLTGAIDLPGATLQKIDSGDWTIHSTGSHWAVTRISDGTLRLGADDALPPAAPLIGDGSAGVAKLDLQGFSQTLSELTLTGTNHLEITNTAAALGRLTVRTDGISTYGESGSSGRTILAGNLRLIKEGSGVLLLGGSNSFSGGTEVRAGTLRFNGGSVLGSSASPLFIADGATLDVNGRSAGRTDEVTVSGSGPDGFGAIRNTGSAVTRGAFWNRITLAGDTTIGTNSRYDVSGGAFNGGTFTLTKAGTGETQWNPAIGATIGDIVVENGVFIVGGDNNLGSDAHRLVIQADAIVSTGFLTSNRKPVAIEGGLLTASSATGFWTGPISLDGAGTSNRIGANAGARVNLSGPITGSNGFEKVDAGTVDLRGTSDAWTGEIKVSAGTLLVSGSIAGSTANVNGGTLGGGGTLGAVNVLAGGALAPGESIGTLTVGAVTFAVGATFGLEINSAALTTDLLVSSSGLDLALATLAAADLGAATLTAGERFTFITAGSVTGTFAGLPNGAPLTVGASRFTIDYTPDSVALVAVPEPGALASLVAGGLGVLPGVRRARRGAPSRRP